MRILFELVLLPLLVSILANVISEWLIRLADKYDKYKQSPECLEQAQKTPMAATAGVFFMRLSL